MKISKPQIVVTLDGTYRVLRGYLISNGYYKNLQDAVQELTGCFNDYGPLSAEDERQIVATFNIFFNDTFLSVRFFQRQGECGLSAAEVAYRVRDAVDFNKSICRVVQHMPWSAA